MYIFKWHNLGLISLILVVVMVVACRGEAPPLATPPTLSPAPTVTVPTLQPTPSPTRVIKIPTTPTPPSEAPSLCGERVEEQARQALANWLGVSSEEIEVVEVEEVEWPDTSLGCPEPGMVYAQVITPGWRVVMRVNDEVYEYHTGGGQGVVCDDKDTPLEWITPESPSPLVTTATPSPEDSPSTLVIEGFDSAQFIFIEVLEELVREGAPYPPEFAMPNNLYVYNPSTMTMLVRGGLTLGEEVRAVVGKVSTTYLGLRPYPDAELFQVPSETVLPTGFMVTELHTDGSAILVYEGQTFSLAPGESRTFKGFASWGESQLQLLKIVTITNHGLHHKSKILEHDLLNK